MIKKSNKIKKEAFNMALKVKVSRPKINVYSNRDYIKFLSELNNKKSKEAGDRATSKALQAIQNFFTDYDMSQITNYKNLSLTNKKERANEIKVQLEEQNVIADYDNKEKLAGVETPAVRNSFTDYSFDNRNSYINFSVDVNSAEDGVVTLAVRELSQKQYLHRFLGSNPSHTASSANSNDVDNNLINSFNISYINKRGEQ